MRERDGMDETKKAFWLREFVVYRVLVVDSRLTGHTHAYHLTEGYIQLQCVRVI